MTEGLAELAAALAVRSLLREAEAGPKPGLVDRFGPGAHADMDIRHFRRSAAALGPYFGLMAAEASRVTASRVTASRAAASRSAASSASVRALAVALRALGVEAEAAMREATGGVNTHKGAIWTLGLLCAASGSLGAARRGEGARPTAEELCDEAAALARAVVGLGPAEGGRPGAPGQAETRGQEARREHGLRTARDEAAAGFPAVRERALPLARELRDRGAPEDELVLSVLLGAMASADDTCLVARGGVAALARARGLAARILGCGGPGSRSGAALYAGMVAEFSAGRLSPGGSADLCAAALFLADFERAIDPARAERRACLEPG